MCIVSKIVIDLLKSDPVRWHALGLVAQLNIDSACIGAGFVRNLVWDHLHDQPSDCRDHDIDVLWFDLDQADAQTDRDLEQQLTRLDSSFAWSVKNQARMHLKNQDAPYRSVADAMSHWPETATAIAAQRRGDHCKLITPFGCEDLLEMVLRPTSQHPHQLSAFRTRLSTKAWPDRWAKGTVLDR